MTTIFPEARTCEVGVRSNSMAGVRSRASVFGVTSLRVVDASGFPTL
jgi:choline dehydrogenase-like flavoprotein